MILFCYTLKNVSGRLCVPNKTKNVNLKVFNITGINESTSLVKHLI